MNILRYTVCALALVAFAACGGKTTKTTKPTTNTVKKPERMNPCGSPINPCGPDIKVPDSGKINPCVGSVVNPCAPTSGGVNPTVGDTASDPATSESTTNSPKQ